MTKKGGRKRKKKPTRETRRLQYPKGIAIPRDWLRFIQLDPFEHCWKALNLHGNDLRALEMHIMLNPLGQPVERGTGGVRKMRFSPEDWAVGKSGGLRVYYLYVPEKGIVFWIFTHPKGQKESLSASDKKQIRALVDEIVNCLENGV